MSHIAQVIVVCVIVFLCCWGPLTLMILRKRRKPKHTPTAHFIGQGYHGWSACKCDEQHGTSICPIHRSGE